MSDRNKVLLIIPAYNEAVNLPGVVEDIEEAAKSFPMDYIIVSDGSTDDTEKICRERKYNFLLLPVNLGLSGCFQTGMKYALRKDYEYTVQFDGDGQHRARDIETLYRKMQEENADIVLGSRFIFKKRGRKMRELGSLILSAAIKLSSGITLTDPTCGLRMYSKKMTCIFAGKLNFGPEPDTIAYLAKNGASICEAPVEIRDRMGGESYLKPWNAVKYMVRMLVSILIVGHFRENI